VFRRIRGVRDRPERREPLRAQLKDRDRSVDVLQAVFPGVAHRTTPDKLASRLREQDLASVPTGREPGREVHIVSDVALVRDKRPARMHPDTQVDPPIGERVRNRLRRGDRSPSGREREEEGVPLGIDLDAAL
jgi:hypothetical protein